MAHIEVHRAAPAERLAYRLTKDPMHIEISVLDLPKLSSNRLEGPVETIDLRGLSKTAVLGLRDALEYQTNPELVEIKGLLEQALTKS